MATKLASGTFLPDNQRAPFQWGAARLAEAGSYDFVIDDAWDTIFAPEGDFDHDKMITRDGLRKHALGLKLIVANECAQKGRSVYINMLKHDTFGANELLGFANLLGLNQKIAVNSGVDSSEPISPEPFIGLYFHADIEQATARDGSTYFRLVRGTYTPKLTMLNGETMPGNRGTVTIDREGKRSIGHYRKKHERDERDTRDKMEDDIPF